MASSTNRKNTVCAGAMAWALAASLCGLAAGPAQAEDDDRRHPQRQEVRHDQGRHEGWRHHDRDAHRSDGYPSYGYSYPQTYYAPPPVAYYPPAPSPGLSFVFPLHIR